MKGAIVFVALVACALAVEDADKVEHADLLQTESKAKFVSPFVNPYLLNPLLYFGAGLATPFLLGGMFGAGGQGQGQAPNMGMMNMAQMGMPGMNPSMGMPGMNLPGAPPTMNMAQTGASAEAKTGAGTGFYGGYGMGYPGMYGGYS